jgi:hypothetical protein
MTQFLWLISLSHGEERQETNELKLFLYHRYFLHHVSHQKRALLAINL